jgi:hypothetical protein
LVLGEREETGGSARSGQLGVELMRRICDGL